VLVVKDVGLLKVVLVVVGVGHVKHLDAGSEVPEKVHSRVDYFFSSV